MYLRTHLCMEVIINNIQQKIDQMQWAYAHQYGYPESVSDPESEQEDIDGLDEAESMDDASELCSD